MLITEEQQMKSRLEAKKASLEAQEQQEIEFFRQQSQQKIHSEKVRLIILC